MPVGVGIVNRLTGAANVFLVAAIPEVSGLRVEGGSFSIIGQSLRAGHPAPGT